MLTTTQEYLVSKFITDTKEKKKVEKGLKGDKPQVIKLLKEQKDSLIIIEEVGEVKLSQASKISLADDFVEQVNEQTEVTKAVLVKLDLPLELVQQLSSYLAKQTDQKFKDAYLSIMQHHKGYEVNETLFKGLVTAGALKNPDAFFKEAISYRLLVK